MLCVCVDFLFFKILELCVCVYPIIQVVYVARNPKDVLVSYFHYHRLIHFHQFNGDLESFADYFMSDKGISLYLALLNIVVCIYGAIFVFAKSADFGSSQLEAKIWLSLFFFLNSLRFAVFPSFTGRLEQTPSPKFALRFLRRIKTGTYIYIYIYRNALFQDYT